MTEHPDQSTIDSKGKGPAKIVYENGEEHRTRNLAYTTALKYITVDGRAITSKGSSVEYIEWLTAVGDE